MRYCAKGIDMYARLTTFTLAMAASMLNACDTPVEATDDVEVNPVSVGTKTQHLYIATDYTWSGSEIPVCWENPGDGTLADRNLVRDTLRDTWGRYTALEFTGWDQCEAGEDGLRILIADEVPHTHGLGTQLDGLQHGVHLNFTFNIWGTACGNQGEAQRRECIASFATHEFGHALGFAHEQNRPDTPPTCLPCNTDGDCGWYERCEDGHCKQGSNGDLAWGDWDQGSIMNYCPLNVFKNTLSVGDVHGAQYSYGVGSILSDYSYSDGWRVDKHVRTVGDIDGDGDDDIVAFGNSGVWVSYADGFTLTQPTRVLTDYGYNTGRGWRNTKHIRVLADVNGDGRQDIVGFGDSGVWVSVATAAGFDSPDRWIANYAYDYGWRLDKHVREMADVNADGLLDVVAFGDSGVWVSLSTGSSFTAPSRWIASFGYNAGGWRVDKHPRMMADVNGDQRADVVGFGYSGVYVALSNGNSFNPASLWEDQYGYNDNWRTTKNVRTMADVNGDGRADVVGFGYSGTFVSLSLGFRFTDLEKWYSDFGYSHSYRIEKNPRFVADVNADGMADLVAFAFSGTAVALSELNDFQPLFFTTRDMAYNAGGWRVDKHPRMLGDINGDGILDLVGFGEYGVHVKFNAPHNIQ